MAQRMRWEIWARSVMSTRMLVIALGVIFTLCFVSVAQAHDGGNWQHKNHYLRKKVIKLHNQRAPGCDLVAKKCPGKKKTAKNVRRYFNTLRALILPRPAARYVGTGRPYRPPAHTASINAGGTLESIASCESGGNPGAVSPTGEYRGKYQFDYRTWQSVGGSGDPAAASEAEQDRRAAMLYSQRGAQPWPVCGR